MQSRARLYGRFRNFDGSEKRRSAATQIGKSSRRSIKCTACMYEYGTMVQNSVHGEEMYC